MKISIVIQYYNRRPLLLNTLRAIQNSKIKQDIEVIITDDASSTEHDISDIPELFSDLNIILFRFEETEKWWHCPVIPANKGISLATGEVVVLLGAECMPIGDVMADIVNRIKPNSYLVYSTLALTEQHTDVLNHMTYEEICNNPLNGFWYQHSQLNNHGFNFCTAIMRDDLLELGGFDERYGWGVDYGDADFVLRLKRYGIEFVTVDSPFVYHQHHEKFIYTEFNSRVNHEARSGKITDQELYDYVINHESNSIKVTNSFLK